jgi:hypothetical protein
MHHRTLLANAAQRIQAFLLGLILLFLLAMMARNAGQPLLDRHSWRQVDTASFARGLAKGSFDVFHVRFLAYSLTSSGLAAPSRPSSTSTP